MFISTVSLPLLAKDAEVVSVDNIHRYKKLVELYPCKASYWNTLGYYYLKSGELELAETHFLRAVEMDASYPLAHNNLGVVYLKQGQAEQAAKEFRQAIRLNPQYCKAQYNLAVALFHQRRFVEAAKAYLQARQIDSKYVDARNNGENIKKKIEEALKQTGEDEESAQELERMKKWFAPPYMAE
jgi:Flp pilus assembly protein TadD